MAAITISRQMGSLGRQVGELVAKKLGYRLVWRDLINQAAGRARAPEVALATIDELDLFGLRPGVKEVRAYHDAVGEVVHELAEQGEVIIVGRAGQVILHGAPDVLHVRIYAPFDLRVERIAKQQDISLEMARGQVQTSDESRRRYLKRYYHARWDDPDLYDVMINTAELDLPAAVNILTEAAAGRFQR